MTQQLFNQLTVHEVQRYTGELELALENHARWLDRVNTALLFRLHPDSRDLVEEPHRHCLFGRWYQSVDDPVLRENPRFAALDRIHQELHTLARRLLMQSGHGEPLSESGYRKMLEKSIQLRELITQLRADFRQDLHLVARLMGKVFDNATEGVIITGPNGAILHVNEGFTRTTGYSAEEVIGRNPNLLYSGRHDDTFYKDMWRAIAEQGRWQGEIWNRRKDGSTYLEWLSISALQDDMGRTINYVGVFSDITKVHDNEKRLYELAHYDALTGLPNRMLFQDLVRQALKHARRHSELVAVMFLDLDGFKAVNDSLGHHAGDLLLKQVAERLQICLRASDGVGRFGGDEFTVVARDLSFDGIRVLAEKIVRLLAEPFAVNGSEQAISVSIGVSQYPSNGRDPERLLRRADIAMYHAKAAGKNGYRVFEPEME